MPVYTYKARDRTGKMVEGNVEAVSQREVALSLRDKGLFVNEIKAPKSGLQMDIKMPAFLDRVGLRDVTIFSRQFATVINAGLPVVQSLNILARQTEKQQFKNALNKVREDVETGQPLSDSLARHPSIFNRLYIYLVQGRRGIGQPRRHPRARRCVLREAGGAARQDPLGDDLPGGGAW